MTSNSTHVTVDYTCSAYAQSMGWMPQAGFLNGSYSEKKILTLKPTRS
jgi:hypothetical protein